MVNCTACLIQLKFDSGMRVARAVVEVPFQSELDPYVT